MVQKKKQQQQQARPSPAAESPKKKKCPNCNYAFDLVEDLEVHVKLHDTPVTLVETNDKGKKKVYVCGDCKLIPKSFSSQNDLNQHKASKH